MRPQKPLPQSWTNFALGRSGFHLSAGFVRTRGEIGVWLVLSGAHAKPHFHQLVGNRAAIESELGTTVEWNEIPNKKQSHIALRRLSDPARREEWPEQHAWLQDTLEAFSRVFGPRIKGLNAEDARDGGVDGASH